MPTTSAGSSDAGAKRRLKQRRIVGAFAGLSVGFVAALSFRLAGYWEFSLESWLWLIAATTAVHAALWLALQLGWDRYLPWDPAFLYVPWATTVTLLCVCIYLLPETRVLIPFAHLAILLFLVGLVGFRQALVFSVLISAGYFGSVFAVWRRGDPVELGYEAMMALLLLALGVFAGTVLHQVRRRRLEVQRAGREIRKLSRAVEQSACLLIITDTEGRIEYVNPRFTRTTGYTPEEAIGQTPRILTS
ncbi:MAG: PAS domain S-box protein, partial [Thermoanaerobaculia bacterium]